MRTILISMYFVVITTSLNAQGRFGSFARSVYRTAETFYKVYDRISTVNDIYQYSIEKIYPNKKYSESSTIPTNIHPNIKLTNFNSITLIDPFEDNSKKLAIDYRKWANSTPELSSKYGKTSKYDLDRTTNGVPNNSYFRKSYTQGKKEFHKVHPLKKYGTNAAPILGAWEVGLDQEFIDAIHSYDLFEESENKKFIEYIQIKTHFDYKEFKLNPLPTSKTLNFFKMDALVSDLLKYTPKISINPTVTGTCNKTKGIQKNNDIINYSYLNQKLEENINKELINFNQEINSIIIKSKYRFNQ